MKLAPARDGYEIARTNEILTINVLIDECRDSLLSYHGAIRARMTHLLNDPPPHGAIPYVSTRTAREEGGRDEVELPFSNHELKNIAELIGMAIREEEMIGELQRYKLRLMNDHDFTHGDPWQQYAVFGPPPELQGDFIILNSDGAGLLFATTEPAKTHLITKLGKRERFGSRFLCVNAEELVESGQGYYVKKPQMDALLAFLRESGFTLTVTETRG